MKLTIKWFRVLNGADLGLHLSPPCYGGLAKELWFDSSANFFNKLGNIPRMFRNALKKTKNGLLGNYLHSGLI